MNLNEMMSAQVGDALVVGPDAVVTSDTGTDAPVNTDMDLTIDTGVGGVVPAPTEADVMAFAAATESLLAFLQDTTDLQRTLASTGGMCVQFAEEGLRLNPDFGNGTPLAYYTQTPTGTQYQTATESLATQALDVIKRLITAIKEMVVKAYQALSTWIANRKTMYRAVQVDFADYFKLIIDQQNATDDLLRRIRSPYLGDSFKAAWDRVLSDDTLTIGMVNQYRRMTNVRVLDINLPGKFFKSVQKLPAVLDRYDSAVKKQLGVIKAATRDMTLSNVVQDTSAAYWFDFDGKQYDWAGYELKIKEYFDQVEASNPGVTNVSPRDLAEIGKDRLGGDFVVEIFRRLEDATENLREHEALLKQIETAVAGAGVGPQQGQSAHAALQELMTQVRTVNVTAFGVIRTVIKNYLQNASEYMELASLPAEALQAKFKQYSPREQEEAKLLKKHDEDYTLFNSRINDIKKRLSTLSSL